MTDVSREPQDSSLVLARASRKLARKVDPERFVALALSGAGRAEIARTFGIGVDHASALRRRFGLPRWRAGRKREAG